MWNDTVGRGLAPAANPKTTAALVMGAAVNYLINFDLTTILRCINFNVFGINIPLNQHLR